MQKPSMGTLQAAQSVWAPAEDEFLANNYKACGENDNSEDPWWAEITLGEQRENRSISKRINKLKEQKEKKNNKKKIKKKKKKKKETETMHMAHKHYIHPYFLLSFLLSL